MTNEEYIKSLPPEQFIKYLTCKACNRTEYDEEQEKCFGDCDARQIEWLKSERKEELCVQ